MKKKGDGVIPHTKAGGGKWEGREEEGWRKMKVVKKGFSVVPLRSVTHPPRLMLHASLREARPHSLCPTDRPDPVVGACSASTPITPSLPHPYLGHKVNC